MNARDATAAPAPTLGARHVTALAIGVVIGAGIFRTPALVAGASANITAFIAIWIVGGLLSIVGALCYAELASAFPDAGGDYHFLERAFGRRLAFLYAWARLAVIQTGSFALLAFLFADYATRLVPLGQHGTTIYAAGVVVVLTALNWVGIRQGARAQLLLTIAEVIGLVGVILCGLLLAPAAPAAPAPVSDTSFGLMLVFVLLTFGGWSETVYLSAELRDGPRRIAPVLIGSLLGVTLLYVAVNFAYLHALGLAGIAASDAVAADVMAAALGPPGAIVISLIVAISALTSANATAITGARTTYAIGASFPALGWLGRWSGARGTPGNALLAQGAAALALVLTGGLYSRDGFAQAVEYTAPVFWLFFLLVGIALFVLRRREPDASRPFRVPLYPIIPAAFCLTSAYLLYSSIAYTGISALVGIAVLGVGALLLPLVERNR